MRETFPAGGGPGEAWYLGEGPPGGLLPSLPPAPPSAPPGCLYANHPGASFAYPPAHFHIPQLWVTAATLFSDPSWELPFILLELGRGEAERKRRESGRRNPSRQREGTIWVAGRKMALSGVGTREYSRNGAWGLGGWLEPEMLDLPASLFTWLWHLGGRPEVRGFCFPVREMAASHQCVDVAVCSGTGRGGRGWGPRS